MREGSPVAGQRKRALSGTPSWVAARLARVRELSAAARGNIPNMHYMGEVCEWTGAHPAPVMTERQREKVVKYINEVRQPPARSPRRASPRINQAVQGGDSLRISFPSADPARACTRCAVGRGFRALRADGWSGVQLLRSLHGSCAQFRPVLASCLAGKLLGPPLFSTAQLRALQPRGRASVSGGGLPRARLARRALRTACCAPRRVPPRACPAPHVAELRTPPSRVAR